MKYLKTYTSVITDSIGGRDDGYLCTKHIVYGNIETLVKGYGTKEDEKYYKLETMDIKELEKEIVTIKEKIEQNKQQEILKEKEKQYELLKQELGK